MKLFISLAVLSAALLLIACSDSDDDVSGVRPTATPEPTQTATTTSQLTPTVTNTPKPTPIATISPEPTVRPTGCPVDDVACDFATHLDSWMKGGNIDAIIEVSQPTEQECPGGQPTGLGGPFPLCEGASAGEIRAGYSIIMLQSEGNVDSEAGLREFVRGWLDSVAYSLSDNVGSGGIRLVSIGCPVPKTGGEASCDGRFAVVFSAITGQAREVFEFVVHRSGPGDEPRVVAVVRGLASLNQVFINGGTGDFPLVFDGSGGRTKYFTWAGATPTPSPVREWDLEDIRVEGSTVTVLLRVYAGIDIRVTLDGRRPDQSTAPSQFLRFVFQNVGLGKHTIQMRDVVGHQETSEVVVSPAAATPTVAVQHFCGISPLEVPSVVPWAPTGEMGCYLYRHPTTGNTVEVLSLESDAVSVTSGESVTFTWVTRGAELAILEVYDGAQLQQKRTDASIPLAPILFFDWLPVAGSKTITLPHDAEGGARAVLWAANRRPSSPVVMFERMAYRVLDLPAR